MANSESMLWDFVERVCHGFRAQGWTVKSVYGRLDSTHIVLVPPKEEPDAEEGSEPFTLERKNE